MIFAWKVLGVLALITLGLCVFVVLFDDKNDDKKGGGKNG